MNDDRRIEKTLGELARRQGQAAPEFDRLLESRKPAGPRWVGLAAAAAVVAVLLASFAWNRATAPNELTIAQLQTLTDWQAPTDVFLTSTDSLFANRIPPLGQTELRIYTGTTEPHSQKDRNQP